MTIMNHGRIANDIAIVNAPSDWMGPVLNVRRHSSIERAAGLLKLGVIRNFDLTSVFTDGRKMEHFPSVEALVQIWEVIGPRRFR